MCSIILMLDPVDALLRLGLNISMSIFFFCVVRGAAVIVALLAFNLDKTWQSMRQAICVDARYPGSTIFSSIILIPIRPFELAIGGINALIVAISNFMANAIFNCAV